MPVDRGGTSRHRLQPAVVAVAVCLALSVAWETGFWLWWQPAGTTTTVQPAVGTRAGMLPPWPGSEDEVLRWVAAQSSAAKSAAVILQVGDDAVLLELKDGGYPIPFWRNCLALLGGNGHPGEAYQDILLRELAEEFSPAFAAMVRPRLARFGDYAFAMSEDHQIATRIYRAKITAAEAAAALAAKLLTGEEGRAVVRPTATLQAGAARFVWAF